MTEPIDILLDAALELRIQDCAAGHRGPWVPVYGNSIKAMRAADIETTDYFPSIAWQRCRHCGTWRCE